jgi:hypothetical protein
VSDQENTPQEGEDKEETEVEGHLLNHSNDPSNTDPSSNDPSKPDVEGHVLDPGYTDPGYTDVS